MTKATESAARAGGLGQKEGEPVAKKYSVSLEELKNRRSATQPSPTRLALAICERLEKIVSELEALREVSEAD